MMKGYFEPLQVETRIEKKKHQHLCNGVTIQNNALMYKKLLTDDLKMSLV